MPDLTKAFEEMRREGLIARLEGCCPGCFYREAMEEAQEWGEQGKTIRGFAQAVWSDHEPAKGTSRVPLYYGEATAGGKDARVGATVARCLGNRGVRYEWDGRASSPIILVVGDDLDGLPGLPHRHDDIDLGNERVLRAPEYPLGAFGWVADNPVRLLDLDTLRRMGVNPPVPDGRPRHPRVGDRVKLGFHVRDAVAPQAREKLGDLAKRVQLESMWVDVTGIEQAPGRRLYRGELVNAPLLIDPARLRIGSPVTFTAEHVYPSAKSARGRASR